MILLKDISTIINAEKVSLLLYYIVNYVGTHISKCQLFILNTLLDATQIYNSTDVHMAPLVNKEKKLAGPYCYGRA